MVYIEKVPTLNFDISPVYLTGGISNLRCFCYVKNISRKNDNYDYKIGFFHANG